MTSQVKQHVNVYLLAAENRQKTQNQKAKRVEIHRLSFFNEMNTFSQKGTKIYSPLYQYRHLGI